MTRTTFPNSGEPITLRGELISTTWFRFLQSLWTRTGAGLDYTIGGIHKQSVTAVGNVGAGEDDLISTTIPKDLLANTGDTLEITVFGTYAANANTKRVKLIFGSTTIFDTTAIAANDKAWRIDATIIRTGATAQEIIANFSGDTTLVTDLADHTTGSETLANSLTIKCTGEATSNDDIIQKALIIKYTPTNI